MTISIHQLWLIFHSVNVDVSHSSWHLSWSVSCRFVAECIGESILNMELMQLWQKLCVLLFGPSCVYNSLVRSESLVHPVAAMTDCAVCRLACHLLAYTLSLLPASELCLKLFTIVLLLILSKISVFIAYY